MFEMYCGSCGNFIKIIGTVGTCKSKNNICACKQPESFVDIYDERCGSWYKASNEK
jgi:hypothetical protein